MPASSNKGDTDEQRRARDRLRKIDGGLAAIIEEHGLVDPYTWSGVPLERGDLLGGLALHIVAQQISTVAALSIYARLVDLLGGGRIDPAKLGAKTPEEIRAVGVSGAKARALQELGARIASGDFDLKGLADSADEEAYEALVSLRGIGPWSADMYMLHELRRPDVFPAGDIGLRKAIALLDGAEEPVAIQEAEARAEQWSPYRSYAAAYLWSFLHDAPRPAL
jgi:3-methyladenine DNA glycosylase/8-oxoguanine DNA glycosylase